MPRRWFDPIACAKYGDEATVAFNQRIVASKKPYFMRYVYNTVMSQYNSYIQSVDRKSVCSYRVKFDDLLGADDGSLTDEQMQFVKYFKSMTPVGMNDCVMNKICLKTEAEFANAKVKFASTGFSGEILKSGVKYKGSNYNAVKELYVKYKRDLSDIVWAKKQFAYREEDMKNVIVYLRDTFSEECMKVCNDKRELCDIVIDLCYPGEESKRFAWDVSGDVIVENLLKRNRRIYIPVQDENGNISYRGKKYSTKIVEVSSYEEDSAE